MSVITEPSSSMDDAVELRDFRPLALLGVVSTYENGQDFVISLAPNLHGSIFGSWIADLAITFDKMLRREW